MQYGRVKWLASRLHVTRLASSSLTTTSILLFKPYLIHIILHHIASKYCLCDLSTILLISSFPHPSQQPIMCNGFSDRWLKCSQHHLNMKECTTTHQPCNIPSCTRKGSRIEWREGYCPYHTSKLPPIKKAHYEKFEANARKRWNAGEKRVYVYKGDKPSSWGKSGSCVVM